jgi:hypothetical protein
VGVLWAIRDPAGAITDFETGYSNPAMARMIGVQTEASMGRRLLAEAPEYLVSDITEQRRMEEELRDYAKVAAHDGSSGAMPWRRRSPR